MSAIGGKADNGNAIGVSCACGAMVSLIFVGQARPEKTRRGKQWGKQIDGSVLHIARPRIFLTPVLQKRFQPRKQL
jgi:hypothetical protein